MNYGIIHNRRPDTRQRGAAQMNALLADPRMREMAKQMGLRPSDFGAEAQAVWQTLNDLSTSDPKRYEEFINDQLRDGPPRPPASNQDHCHDTEMAAELPTPPAPRFFTPTPGFVVKCAMFHSIKCQQRETKLFLNCCAHELVDAPQNPNNGSEVPADTRAVPSTSNLQIPLAVGKLREISDCHGALSCALDVVVHPWVLRRCDWDAAFKREVMKLAVHWVQQDAKVRLVTPVGRLIKARYKGGVTIAGEIITAKFRIDEATAGSKKQRMESPADLLKRMSMEEDKEPELTLETSIAPKKNSTLSPDVLLKPKMAEKVQPPPAPATSRKEDSKSKKVLIEELPSPTSTQKAPVMDEGENPATKSVLKASKSTHVVKKKTKRSAGAVKRGFLNSTKTQLYPKGSSEGHAPSAYVKLLSRSKVVDLGEAERQHKAQEEQRKQNMASLLQTMDSEDAKTNKLSSQEGEVDYGDYAFEQLCLQADPDLQPASGRRDGVVGGSGDGALGLEGNFEALSKLLAP